MCGNDYVLLQRVDSRKGSCQTTGRPLVPDRGFAKCFWAKNEAAANAVAQWIHRSKRKQSRHPRGDKKKVQDALNQIAELYNIWRAAEPT
jgi:hypothetical protein